jgi:hypothetical protein
MPVLLGRSLAFARCAALLAAVSIALQIPAPPADAAPVFRGDEVDDAFLTRLLDAINERRDAVGTQRLAFVPARANAALDPFLAETAPSLAWPGPCLHHLVNGAFSWDYVLAAGFAGDPRGEVLACPGPEPYWTPDRTAAQWFESPIHHGVLYADGDSNALACSAYGVSGEGQGRRRNRLAEAASAVLCVTFRS